jgi:DNA (cytosine-5)-methyltransferase 1
MTGLSLFSGIGGLDLAFEAAGGRVIAMCEIDPFCRKVLQKHWPHVPIFGDIKKLRVKDVGTVDIIFGGPPCQPVSLAGRRRGQDDDRYLWGDVFRIVSDLMPRFCVFENVFGILSIAADDICKELDRIGYSVGICCYEAASIGALHRRMRVFFVANTRRELFKRRSIHGAISSEHEGREVADDKRPSSALIPNATGHRRDQREPDCGGGCEGTSTGEEYGSSNGGASIPNTKRMRKLQQERLVSDQRGRIGNGCRRFPEPDVGGVAYGIPHWMDGSYWTAEPDIPRTGKGIKNRAARLQALGNAVVPAHAFPIFKAIMETDSYGR